MSALFTIKDRTAFLVCSRCHGAMAVAYGFCAFEFTNKQAVQAAIFARWTAAPMLICSPCLHGDGNKFPKL